MTGHGKLRLGTGLPSWPPEWVAPQPLLLHPLLRWKKVGLCRCYPPWQYCSTSPGRPLAPTQKSWMKRKRSMTKRCNNSAMKIQPKIEKFKKRYLISTLQIQWDKSITNSMCCRKWKRYVPLFSRSTRGRTFQRIRTWISSAWISPCLGATFD